MEKLPVNNIEKPKIKEGVSFIFEENPEFIQIGTKEQYSEYLDTIFPHSKIKDIVWHGSDKKITRFRKPTAELSLGKPAIYFRKDIVKHKKDSKISNAAIVNSEFPLIVEDFNEYSERRSRIFHDSIYIKDEDEFAVFEPEQIHILSTKFDIEKFKEFVSGNNK